MNATSTSEFLVELTEPSEFPQGEEMPCFRLVLRVPCRKFGSDSPEPGPYEILLHARQLYELSNQLSVGLMDYFAKVAGRLLEKEKAGEEKNS